MQAPNGLEKGTVQAKLLGRSYVWADLRWWIGLSYVGAKDWFQEMTTFQTEGPLLSKVWRKTRVRAEGPRVRRGRQVKEPGSYVVVSLKDLKQEWHRGRMNFTNIVTAEVWEGTFKWHLDTRRSEKIGKSRIQGQNKKNAWIREFEAKAGLRALDARGREWRGASAVA